MRLPPSWLLLVVIGNFMTVLFLIAWNLSAQQQRYMDAPSSSLAFGSASHESVAVVVPFTAKDEEALVSALHAWQTYMPCNNAHASFLHTEVFFYFNHDLSKHDRLKHAIRSAALAIRGHCIRQFHYVSANLQGSKDDIYDKRRRSQAWVSGPNAMFYRLFTRSDSNLAYQLSPFRVVLWLEPDVRPLRSDWLVSWAQRFPADFWVMGSAYLGECADDSTGECRFLGPRISNHINGNAAYHYASDPFREFLLKRVLIGDYKLWPFDLAIYLQIHHSPEPDMRRLLHRYVYTNLIQNYGDYPYTLDSVPRGALLVHGLKSNASIPKPIAIPLPPQEMFSYNDGDPLQLNLDSLPNFFAMLSQHSSRDILEPLYKSATLAVIETRTDDALLRRYRKLLSAVALDRNCTFAELSSLDGAAPSSHSSSSSYWRQQPVCVFLLRSIPTPSELAPMTSATPRGLCSVTLMPSAGIRTLLNITDDDSLSDESMDEAEISHVLKQRMCFIGGALSWSDSWEMIFSIFGMPRLRMHTLLANASNELSPLGRSLLDDVLLDLANDTQRVYRSWQLEAGSRLTYQVERNAHPRKQIAITFASSSYREMWNNWVHFVRKVGMVHMIAVAIDPKAEAFMLESGAAVLRMFIGTTGSDEYHSDAFKKICNMRYAILLQILRMGYDIFILDLDVLMIQNPMPFEYPPDHDITFLSDSRVPFLEKTPNNTYDPFVNGGVFYARSSSKRALAFLDWVVSEMQRDPNVHDQDHLNRCLNNLTTPLNYKIFDRTTWANGYVYYELAAPQEAGVTPVLLHGNWAEGFRTKVYRFKEANMWYTYPGSIRIREGRYLTYWNDLAEDGLNNQFVSLRSALAIAQILNRTLILPKFSAYHKIPSERLFDYYFDYNKFAAAFPNHVPNSLLQFIPADLLYRNVVHISHRNSTWKKPPGWIRDATIYSPLHQDLGATDDEIVRWLAPYQDEVVLFVDDMFRAFLRFEDPQAHKSFTKKFRDGVVSVPSLLGIAWEIHKGAGDYNCIHLRRGDFLTVHNTEKPLPEVAQLATDLLPTTESVYIATDSTNLEEVKSEFERYFPRAIFTAEFFPPWEAHAYNFSNYLIDGKLGVIDQHVCSRAKKFVGNLWSTFTMHICALREHLGHDPPCVDIYGREKPEDMPFV